MDETHRLIQDRLKKLDELRAAKINPYPYSFNQKDHADALLKAHAGLKPGEETTTTAAVAGRIVLLRKMGKASFGHVQDATGKIQFFAAADDMGAAYSIVQKLDMGDYLGVEGTIFATKTGEITVKAKKLTLLAKSLRPLPEKHHGLQDVETRYRKRYLDVIANPEVKDVFVKRAKIIGAMRTYLDNKGFLEVETPTLQPVYGGAHARPFTTHHNALDQELYLRISDELYLKRLSVGGFERVYELCKDFRNEGVDTRHNPEFTMLEWYLAYGDYQTGMVMFEEIVAAAAKAARGTTKLTYQGKPLDVTPPWKRVTMASLIKEHAKIDVLSMGEKDLRAYCEQERIVYLKRDAWGTLVQLIFEAKCEEHLWGPVFVIDHPIESTPLCKPLRSGDARFVERFEPFIAGMEVGNAYSELNDPVLQKQLLQDQNELKMKGDEEANPMDADFVEAIEHGMPPTSGVGIGVDRIVMLLTDSASIRDVILFPAMKPEEKGGKK